MIASFHSKDPTHAPLGIPCVTILFLKAKPDEKMYIEGMSFARQECSRLFNGDFVNDVKLLFGMGNMEIK